MNVYLISASPGGVSADCGRYRRRIVVFEGSEGLKPHGAGSQRLTLPRSFLASGRYDFASSLVCFFQLVYVQLFHPQHRLHHSL
jgi:hypothetical protein